MEYGSREDVSSILKETTDYLWKRYTCVSWLQNIIFTINNYNYNGFFFDYYLMLFQ